MEIAGLFARIAGHVRTLTQVNRKWLFIKKRFISATCI